MLQKSQPTRAPNYLTRNDQGQLRRQKTCRVSAAGFPGQVNRLVVRLFLLYYFPLEISLVFF
jgi:hypothetical protein